MQTSSCESASEFWVTQHSVETRCLATEWKLKDIATNTSTYCDNSAN